jgi:hypothetical protein
MHIPIALRVAVFVTRLGLGMGIKISTIEIGSSARAGGSPTII